MSFYFILEEKRSYRKKWNTWKKKWQLYFLIILYCRILIMSSENLFFFTSKNRQMRLKVSKCEKELFGGNKNSFGKYFLKYYKYNKRWWNFLASFKKNICYIIGIGEILRLRKKLRSGFLRKIEMKIWGNVELTFFISTMYFFCEILQIVY